MHEPLPTIHAQIHHITAPLYVPQHGDTDYTEMLTGALRCEHVDARYIHHFAHDKPTREDVVIKLKKAHQGHQEPQILHLQLRPPLGGTALEPQDMKIFDRSVVTVHEFTELEASQRARVLQYVRQADHVIFTTPGEQAAVADKLPEVMYKSTVIPICECISLHAVPPEEKPRPNNIINFGSIRAGKGYSDLMRLAHRLKDEKGMEGTKIIIAGSSSNAQILASLIQESYGLKDADMPQMGSGSNQNNAVLKAFLAQLEKTRKPVLPVELHVDVPEQELPKLFERAAFAYMPVKRGATQHSTALPAVMGNHCVTFTYKGPQTPAELCDGALVFVNSDAELLKEMRAYMRNPELGKATRAKAQAYLDSISPLEVAHKHMKVYDAVLSREPELEGRWSDLQGPEAAAGKKALEDLLAGFGAPSRKDTPPFGTRRPGA